MIIPLTPIREAWGGVEPEQQAPAPEPFPMPPQSPPQQEVSGYAPNGVMDSYRIPEGYVPNAMDVTVYDQDVIRSLHPMTSNKRSDLVTELLSLFFKKPMSEPKNRVEYFRTPPSGTNTDADSVHMIVILLLAYILVDKLMMIWSRS